MSLLHWFSFASFCRDPIWSQVWADLVRVDNWGQSEPLSQNILIKTVILNQKSWTLIIVKVCQPRYCGRLQKMPPAYAFKPWVGGISGENDILLFKNETQLTCFGILFGKRCSIFIKSHSVDYIVFSCKGQTSLYAYSTSLEHIKGFMVCSCDDDEMWWNLIKWISSWLCSDPNHLILLEKTCLQNFSVHYVRSSVK